MRGGCHHAVGMKTKDRETRLSPNFERDFRRTLKRIDQRLADARAELDGFARSRAACELGQWTEVTPVTLAIWDSLMGGFTETARQRVADAEQERGNLLPAAQERFARAARIFTDHMGEPVAVERLAELQGDIELVRSWCAGHPRDIRARGDGDLEQEPTQPRGRLSR